MSGHGTKLKRKLEEAVAAMLTQRNIEEAARSVDVSTATLMRWQKLPEFQKAYRDARRAAHNQSVARLQQATSAAVSTLLKVMVDPRSGLPISGLNAFGRRAEIGGVSGPERESPQFIK